ncbi:hypothetical protein BKI52_24480 [marine bacterium AO1-C]|nr:hypothetical protein BKI52_24480 [marine bacterium AO1-C]
MLRGIIFNFYNHQVMKNAVYLLAIILFFASCNNNEGDDPTPQNEVPTLALTASQSPITTTAQVNFYKDVSYGSDNRNVFDFFAPESSQATPLVIYIHGGGFTAGNKEDIYNEEALINSFLSNNIAFATINYRLLQGASETEGVLKPLNDSKTALQFIRYYASSFNIDKNKVVLMGSSAGAGTSLWIGLNNELADANATDDILKESTRVQGIIAVNTQSTYDVADWHTTVFSEYASQGMDQDTVVSLVEEGTVLQFYGMSSLSELTSPTVVQKRMDADMLSLMSGDDPEIYVSRPGAPYRFPADKSAVLHHPLHAKVLMDKASATGVACVAIIPQMNIDNSNGESITNFVLRKIGN